MLSRAAARLERKPDFNHVLTALQPQEPDRVPLAEAAIDYKIMSQFLGRTVSDDDVASQVEFWTKAGWRVFPISASDVG